MQLIKGNFYKFYFEDFETPFGEVIKKEPKEYKFVQKKSLGAVGNPKIDFYQVFNEDRKILIAVETVDKIEVIKEGE